MFANPLPMVMVALLAGSVLVKNVTLESARPIDPERAKYVPTAQQDVEARLWRDPFAAVEKHAERYPRAPKDAETSKVHNPKIHSDKELKKILEITPKILAVTL